MNAVQYIKKRSHWELKATEIGYAVCIEDIDNKKYDIFPFMRPPTPDDEKRIREEGGVSNEIFDIFFDNHFLRLVGVNIDSVKEHKKFINSYTNLKRFIYEEGPGGAKNLIESVDDLTSNDVIIKLVQFLWCTKKKKPVKMSMSYTFGHLEVGRRLYESALSGGMEDGEVNIRYDLNAVDKIISGCLTDIKGYCVDKKPCEMDSINEWFSILPFEHKVLAADEAFKPAEAIA